jgi:glucose/arabinose dehydrogenase
LSARAFLPVDIWIDGEGRILFTDEQGERIVRVDDMSGKGLVTYPPSDD